MNLALRSVAAFVTLAACSAAAFGDAHVDSRRLRVRLDPASGTVEGVAELRVAVDAPSVLTLELAGGLQVTSVLRDGAAVERVIDSPLGNRTTAWRFPLDATAHRGIRALVSVTWSGTYEASPGASFTAGRIDLPLSARWSPTPDHATPWEARIDVPAELRCVLRGVPRERVESDERAVETWSSDLPSQGLALAAGPWTSAEQTVDGTTITVWGAKPDPTLLSEMAAAFEAVGVVIGPCPAARFDVLPDDVLMAAAAPGLGSRVWGDPTTQAARAWWGHAVSEDPAGGAWADALALYIARQLVIEDTDPEAALRFRKETMSHLTPDAAADDPHRRLLAFHAIREEIGSVAFTDALRAVLRDHTGDAIGWDRWSRAFSEAVGRDVSSRVEQWTTRQGAPLLELSRAELTTAGGRMRISGTIRQAVRAGEEPWRLTVPVVVELLAGTQTVLVEVGGDETGFSEILDGLPVSVAVDPELRVPRRLVPGPGKERLVTERSLLPSVEGARGEQRVAALMTTLAASERWDTAVAQELRIGGLDAHAVYLPIVVRSRAAGDVVTTDGASVAGCLPLTCSPETPESGVEISGTADDPGDDLTGRALVVDVPRGTTDLPEFARELAAIARPAGAAALVLRLPTDASPSLERAWRTPAEASEGETHPVLYAHDAQRERGDELALPTVVAPSGFAPAGAFLVRVRWQDESTRVPFVSAPITARGDGAGRVLLIAHASAKTPSSGAAAVAEAAQLLAPHVRLMGRHVVMYVLPADAGSEAVIHHVAAGWPEPPHVTISVGPVGDAAEPFVRVVGSRGAEDVAAATIGALRQAGLDAAGDPRTRLLARFAKQRGPIVTVGSPAPPAPGTQPDAARVAHVARGIALAVLAASIAP